MKIKYFECVTKEAYLADIMELLSLCDQEFIPPLSARSSTIQSNLGPQGGKREGPVAYFENIQHQPAFLAVDDGRVVGFMSLKKNYVCEEIPPSHSPNVYVTTVIVHPHYRRHGITNGFRIGWDSSSGLLHDSSVAGVSFSPFRYKGEVVRMRKVPPMLEVMVTVCTFPFSHFISSSRKPPRQRIPFIVPCSHTSGNAGRR